MIPLTGRVTSCGALRSVAQAPIPWVLGAVAPEEEGGAPMEIYGEYRAVTENAELSRVAAWSWPNELKLCAKPAPCAASDVRFSAKVLDAKLTVTRDVT